MPDWKNYLAVEFERAEVARAAGNEGQARVCARRAAGIALREYYSRHGWTLHRPGAYELLLDFIGSDFAPAALRQLAAPLTVRVNEQFNLPLDIDLVMSARHLCAALFPDELN
jgi:hypothetical protein